MSRSKRDNCVVVDTNLIFEDALNLQKPEKKALIKAIRKIQKLTWAQFVKDSGLNWEKIVSRNDTEDLHSFRITQKFRALGYREGDWLRIVSLHPDHDGAYR